MPKVIVKGHQHLKKQTSKQGRPIYSSAKKQLISIISAARVNRAALVAVHQWQMPGDIRAISDSWQDILTRPINPASQHSGSSHDINQSGSIDNVTRKNKCYLSRQLEKWYWKGGDRAAKRGFKGFANTSGLDAKLKTKYWCSSVKKFLAHNIFSPY